MSIDGTGGAAPTPVGGGCKDAAAPLATTVVPQRERGGKPQTELVIAPVPFQ